MDEITEDAVLDGRIRLRQPARGYRAGADAALLAAACDAAPGARVIEAGCGAGGALLAAAARRPQARFLGLERDPSALALARENVVLNDLQNRVDVLLGDVAAGFQAQGLEAFDAAIANPPFFDDEKALRGPSPQRRGAWIADDGLAAWTGFLLAAVRPGGTITLIHRADRRSDLLALLGEGAGAIQVRPIHPHADEPAKRVVVRAVKGAQAPSEVLPPLVMHVRGGAKHASEAEEILRGRAALAWR